MALTILEIIQNLSLAQKCIYEVIDQLRDNDVLRKEKDELLTAQHHLSNVVLSFKRLKGIA